MPVSGFLAGVAPTSARNGWAVGGTNGGETLIVHWNAIAWKRVPSPSPPDAQLHGVAATSATNAWAVGQTNAGILILHWNGTAWKREPSPAAAGGILLGAAATSARNAWAVDQIEPRPGVSKSLILHWNGTAWQRAPSQRLRPGLMAVTAASAADAWAVGHYLNFRKTLIVHWNGRTWKRAPSPSPGPGAVLDGVGRHLRQERLGGGRHRWRNGPDPALERHDLETGGQREPGNPPRRRRHARHERLGGRPDRTSPRCVQDPSLALERHNVEKAVIDLPRLSCSSCRAQTVKQQRRSAAAPYAPEAAGAAHRLLAQIRPDGEVAAIPMQIARDHLADIAGSPSIHGHCAR